MSEDAEDESAMKMQLAATDILNRLSLLEDANEALQALTASMAYVLCNGVYSEEEAYAACLRISNILRASMKSASERGDTIWNPGAYH